MDCTSFEIIYPLNDISRPRHTEKICICTDRPDHEQQNAEIKRAAVGSVSLAADFTPFDISSIPDEMALMSGGTPSFDKSSQIMVLGIEKNSIQAHTFSIPIADSDTDEVIAVDKVGISFANLVTAF